MIVGIKLPAPVRRLILATRENLDGRFQCKHLQKKFTDEFYMVSNQEGSQSSPNGCFRNLNSIGIFKTTKISVDSPLMSQFQPD